MNALNRRSFWKLCAGAPLTAAVVVRDDTGAPAFVGDVSVLRVQAGDVVIITAPGMISDESATRIKAAFERYCGLPADIRFAVMGDGLKVDRVLRVTS